TDLKLSHWVATTHPFHRAIAAWSEDLKRATGSELNVSVHPVEELGGAIDHLSMVEWPAPLKRAQG
ncbi:hypothetical protein ACSTJP_00415, partial [Vibrio parahaemolyticus]